MTWVKVCGLTNADDVGAAVEAGADAVGFVNVPSSPRYLAVEDIAALAKRVPVHSILLTLDLAGAEAVRVLAATRVNGIQPYGDWADEAAAAAQAAGYVVLRPVRAAADLDLTDIPGIPLLDTPSTKALGGTGKTFDWSLVADLGRRFVLAGGLGPDNVANAVRRVRPWGVDASSGLEKQPGRKDHSMVASFIAEAKKL